MAILKIEAEKGQNIQQAVETLKHELYSRNFEKGVLVFNEIEVDMYVTSDERDVVEKYFLLQRLAQK